MEPVSFFRTQGWSRRGWMAFLFLFLPFIFSRLERRVAVATTRRRPPAHLHHTGAVSVDSGCPRGSFLLWETQQLQRKSEGERGRWEEGWQKGGHSGRKSTAAEATSVFLNKTGQEFTRRTGGTPRNPGQVALWSHAAVTGSRKTDSHILEPPMAQDKVTQTGSFI